RHRRLWLCYSRGGRNSTECLSTAGAPGCHPKMPRWSMRRAVQCPRRTRCRRTSSPLFGRFLVQPSKLPLRPLALEPAAQRKYCETDHRQDNLFSHRGVAPHTNEERIADVGQPQCLKTLGNVEHLPVKY